MRVHGPFVSDEEIERVTGFLKEKSRPQYVDINEVDLDDAGYAESSASSGSDDVYQQAVAIVLRDRKTSISYLQRQMQIGYNRAARLIETMEKKGILSPPNHLGKRDILS